MARLIRAHAWAATPLGPIASWPPSLRTLVGLMLGSRRMMGLMWGRSGLMLYNDAYARGLREHHPEALGRSVFDVWSHVGSAWEPLFAQAWAGEEAQARELPLRLAGADPTAGREGWFDLTYTPVRDEGGAVAGVLALIVDATERVLAARARREMEERQAFLLRLSDALHPLGDPVAIQAAAARILGEHLGADRACYVALDEGRQVAVIEREYRRGDAPSLVGEHAYAVFGAALDRLRAGGAVVVGDVEAEPMVQPADLPAYRALGLRAFAKTPLVKDGAPIGAMYVVSAAPRRWSAAEAALVEEVGQRTWAAVERARAEAVLRDSEARFRSFAEASTDALWIVDAGTGGLDYLSPAFEQVWGAPRDGVMTDLSVWADSVLPQDRPGPGEGLAAALSGRITVIEYRIRRPDGQVRHIRDTGFPILGVDGRVRRVGGIAQDLTERRRAELALVANERRLRSLVEGIPQLVWSAVGEGRWTWASPQWVALTGLSEPESRGLGWLEALHPEDRPAALAAWAAAEAMGGFDLEYRLRRAQDGQYRWHATRAVPVRDDAGAIVEWLGTSTDIDDLRRIEAQSRLLVAELQHRTRNLVGVVRSIADRTLRGVRSFEDFQARFSDRMSALARVQGLLSRRDVGRRVTLEEVIRTELAGLGLLGSGRDGARVTLDGPEDVRLRDAGVQTFSLALHELATNALKHGALAQPGGRLRVSWAPERDGADPPGLVVVWEESGARPRRRSSEAAERRGYGRELIERALPFQLGARTEWDLRPGGLRCVIAIPQTDGQGEGTA